MFSHLKVGYFYPKLLNLYGDNGNVEILMQRAKLRGFEVATIHIGIDTQLNSELMKTIDIVFMGGGPDSKQKFMYDDLLKNKGPWLREYIEGGGAGLFICGSYQLLGHYYKSADGSMLEGLGIFDLYTEHFGLHKPRCIGNTVAKVSSKLLHYDVFVSVNTVGDTIVGFENHGGRTYLGENSSPFAKVITGHGNNSEDGTEGVFYKNSIGTYFHGPLLARNPHIADFLLAKGLNVNNLTALDDSLILSAHTASLKLKQ
jgi:hypothetical protein